MSEARKHKPTKGKRPFSAVFSKYKTYDPQVEGYGDPDEWVNQFRWRMGFEEAQAVVNKRSPFHMLGLAETCTWLEVKTAYRHMALQYHPDRIKQTGLTEEQATERFKEISAAYTVLDDRFNKKR